MIYTIGHSTRSIENFIAILKNYEISQLVDIRTIPKSRRNPQYGQENLKESLEVEGIQYIHMKDLGGLRPSTGESVNKGWKNQSFRNYADYMQTDEFVSAVNELKELCRAETTAMMCAEAVPWRCHRRLVGDALIVRGEKVWDIFDLNNVREHTMTPFAEVEGKKIIYPSDRRFGSESEAG
ncbi:DUF488 domain-containing protein [Membranicola marinus]|uniref:DUF488 domain-containing protein n=1 Tax=Membranihabitans marinus TaxID=1227546 RepID=A0A953HKU0_9BACT|nr:DUF488 domain-containing protein [Membranihabitans marinus]MBY5956899.1 DUF488 domain-containing protein [Membranihabitans marinus]